MYAIRPSILSERAVAKCGRADLKQLKIRQRHEVNTSEAF